ncbi:UDP-glucose 4-epimerase GEPI42-like [Vigna radiata var. radiata]|uniref:UDP-glucose 4-epimerase GEPI42-like n=1 Tax=Vigna radiata var. radiata TaxID=3916 RepID=A0A1S3TBB9_VIGRR|nr:UDP-glucose 4-epimerase GEPI42-like [Vigna radiata var. radiata]
MDNLNNSVIEAIDRVRRLGGAHLANNLIFCHGDLRNPNDLEALFSHPDQAIAKFNCKNMVISSSATVYGQPHQVILADHSAEVALGRLPELKISDHDYPTKDDTPVSHSISFVLLHLANYVASNHL